METSHIDYQELDLRAAVCRNYARGPQRVPHHSKIAAGGFKAAGAGDRRQRAARRRREAGPFGKHGKHVN
jgi:hypothetical protein